MAESSSYTDQHTVPFTISKYGLLFTTVMINGQEANTLIDLGDPNKFQLSTTFIEDQGLEVTKTGDVSSDVQGNTFDLYEGLASRIELASVAFDSVPFLSGYQELEFVGKQVKSKIDAAVGWGFFKDYNLKIDYRAQQILLFERPIEEVTHLEPIGLNKDSSYLILEAELDTTQVRLLLDTGAQYSVIDSTFFSQQNLEYTNVKVRKYLIFSMEFKRIRTTFDGQPFFIEYYPYHLPELNRVNAVGILGGSFFKNYLVYILPASGKVYFQPYPS